MPDDKDKEIPLDEAIDTLADKFGVPRPLWRRLVGQESSGNVNVGESPKGARGLFQIMPATARNIRKPDGTPINPNDPLEAAYGGLKLLSDNYKQFRPRAQSDRHAWGMALAGYHGNPQNVIRDLDRGGLGIPDQDDGHINTQDYVANILRDVPDLNGTPNRRTQAAPTDTRESVNTRTAQPSPVPGPPAAHEVAHLQTAFNAGDVTPEMRTPEYWQQQIVAQKQQGIDQAYPESHAQPERRPLAPSADELLIRASVRNKPKLAADLQWHFGPDALDQMSQVTPAQRRAMILIAAREAGKDAARKADHFKQTGEWLQIPQSEDWQNQNRAKVGLKPIVPMSIGELRSRENNLAAVDSTGELRRLEDRVGAPPGQDEALRSQIRKQVMSERAARQQGPMTPARSALAMVDQGQGAAAIEEEVTRRLTAEREQQAAHQQIVSQFTDSDRAEIQDFVNAVRGSGEKTQGLRLATRAVGSDLLYKLAGLTDLAGPPNVKNELGDWLRRKAAAGDLSVEDVRRELKPSRQRDLAEFISSLPLGVAGVAPFVMAGGPVAGFAASGFTGAVGRQKPASEVLRDTAKEATLGAVFKGAGSLESGGATLARRIGDVAKSGVGIGAGTFAVEKGFGATNEEAAKSAGTNILLHGAMSAPGVLRGSANTLPEQRQEDSPQGSPETQAPTQAEIYRAEEPYAGPAEFRGMAVGDLYDLATRRPPKGTSRQGRLELIRTQAAAIAEIDRRQNQGPLADIAPPDTGLRAESGDVPSFRDYVENRPGGGLRFETLEPGSRDFNQLAGEYVQRYGTRASTVPPQQAPSPRPASPASSEAPLTNETIANHGPDPRAGALQQPITRDLLETVSLPTGGIGDFKPVNIRPPSTVPAYVREEIDRRVATADKLGISDQIEELAAQRKTAKQTQLALQDVFKIAQIAPDEARGIVRAVRSKRGIPSVEERGEFEQWLQNRNPPEAQPGETRPNGPPPRKDLPPLEPRTIGRESQAVTERGSEINTRYAVVDLGSLITSHDSALRPNPDFPGEIQPRERDRAASAEQISRIASNLRPEFLGESPKASEGAPIVGPDGIVESGNGRVLGLRQAFESNNKGATAYRRYLLDNAEKLGLDRSAIKGMKSPVLVRIRATDVDRPQFVKEANEQSVAAMSAVEQARSDATSLKGSLLDLFRPSETGEINTAGNMNFVRAFMKDVVGPNEVNRYVTATGQVSQEGIARIRNAIFARAYGDSPEGLTALEKLAESTDSNVRNIVTAMLRNAPRFASLKEGIDQGVRYPLDAAPDVAAAVSRISALRESGTPVADYLRQGALYGEDLTPLQKRLLQVFDENKRGANTISAILENYARGAEAAGDPRQAGMFGGDVPSKADLLEAAIQEAIHGQGRQTGLFTAEQHQGLPGKPAPGKNLPEANPPELFERPAAAAGPTVEAEGRPLGRLDSAIDRLKVQEEDARQRLAQRAAEQQKLIEEKGSEAGATIIPQDIYDYVVIGASKLAQRSLNAAQFVDEMVREFGESIRKHARAIFKFSQKMVVDTQKEIRAERLSKEIANRLFTENVPKQQQREALRIAARFRTSTDTQGRFLSGFKSRVGEMAKSYGAAGGELTNRVHLGDIARGHEMEAGNKYLSKIQDVYGDIKNDFERQRISDSVIKALEDRANAERHLDTPEKKAVYENTVEMLDTFRAKLKALGYETRDDYFTHIRDVDILDQTLSDAKDPKDTSLNELVAVKSRFLQPRIDAKMEIKRDLPRVLYAYLKSVTKEIAYSDAVGYYYDHFIDDIPIGLRKNSMDRAIKLMQNSLKPEQGRGRFFRAVGALRSQQYRNFLSYNLKASAQNFTQVDFARMRWTKEAASLTGDLWRKRKVITGPLADAIDLASTESTPLMRFLEQFKGDDPSGTHGRFAEAFNKYDPFQRSEGRNWAMSELGSIINSVVKRPEYKELKASKGSIEAINELLKKQDVFDGAVREAATTAAETQVAANPATRAEFYDVPLHRIIGMFTAFKTRQIQILGEALRKQTGIDGARAQAILRRGLSGDAQPVEVLREIEAQRRAMETMMKRADKFNEDIGVPRPALREMLRHLKTQENELDGIIKRLEPLSGGRPRAVLLTAKYFAKVGAISVFFNLFWDSVYSAIAGPDEEKDAEERVSIALKRAFWDILPSPFYGADPSKFLVSPVAPNFERSAPFGHITRRGLARDVVGYAATVIPFAGVVDRATNRNLSGAVVDLVAPKKERERKIKF